MTHLQQTTFENIATKEEIARDEQFLLLPQCFQLYLLFILSFIVIFVVFFTQCFQSRLLQICRLCEVTGKGSQSETR